MEPRARSAGRKPVASRLELEFAADTGGRTFLRRQYAGYPFHVCRAQYQDEDLAGLATLYVQSCSGGIYQGDRLALSIAMAEGAQAHVTTQAATVVHTMPEGHAEQRVGIRCGDRSYLEYLPDPQILFPGSTCRSSITVRLAAHAVALVSDSLLQHDPAGKAEPFDAYLGEVVVEDPDGVVLAVDRLQFDGMAVKQRWPGVSGVFGAQGTLVLAGLDFPQDTVAEELRTLELNRDAVMGFSRLPNEAGMLVRLLADDGAILKRGMHAVWGAVRLALKSSLPAERRK